MSTYEEMREDAKRDAYIQKMRNWSCGHSGNCPCAQPDPCEACGGTGQLRTLESDNAIGKMECIMCGGAAMNGLDPSFLEAWCWVFALFGLVAIGLVIGGVV